MDYRRKIALGAFFRTATFIEVVAAYEGEERRKEQRRQEQRRTEPRPDQTDRREKTEPTKMREEYERRVALPKLGNIGDNDVIAHITPAGSKILTKALKVLAEFPSEATTADVWNKIEELRENGQVSGKIYYTTHPDPKTANLQDAEGIFRQHVLSKKK